ncbi:universal stress protein UspA [Planomonospora sphaerica]|uniref:Universal stress protein UspA n=1 Tax=Planomonospora sphaerica TaxID=161355 RepID=A0A171DL19_9ACTN|nr:universal stress protein [Planomonospora sphaerica]GAT69520.1 universal stress protein UspA [Planomonospora sphaerica]
MTGQIVVGIDGSASASAAVEWAADAAGCSGAALKIVHVREPWAMTAPVVRSQGIEESLAGYAESLLAAAAGRARERAPGVTVTSARVTGAVAERLRTEAERAEALVIGSRGTGGFAGLVLGSVALSLAGHAVCPVVVVRAPARTVHGVIVVGFDDSGCSQAAVEYAFVQARLRRCRLRALHAWRMPLLAPYALGYAPEQELEGLFREEAEATRRHLAAWREKYPDVEVEESVVHGHPIPVLSDASREADLVVVGSHGRSGFGAVLLGSVGHGVLHRAHCPVAVVGPQTRPAGESRPQ